MSELWLPDKQVLRLKASCTCIDNVKFGAESDYLSREWKVFGKDYNSQKNFILVQNHHKDTEKEKLNLLGLFGFYKG